MKRPPRSGFHLSPDRASFCRRLASADGCSCRPVCYQPVSPELDGPGSLAAASNGSGKKGRKIRSGEAG